MRRGDKRVVEAEKGGVGREVEASLGHEPLERGGKGREWGMENRSRREARDQEGKREKGQVAPFIVGQAYLAVVRKLWSGF